MTSEQQERRSLANRIMGAWVNDPRADWLIGISILAVLFWRRPGLLSTLDPITRRALYQTVAALNGTLLGFVLTSVSILIALLREDFAEATAGTFGKGKQRRAASYFFATIRALALALLSFVAALVLDTTRSAGSDIVQAALIAVAVVAASRLARIIWVLSRLVAISVTGTSATASPNLIEDCEA